MNAWPTKQGEPEDGSLGVAGKRDVGDHPERDRAALADGDRGLGFWQRRVGSFGDVALDAGHDEQLLAAETVGELSEEQCAVARAEHIESCGHADVACGDGDV